MVWGLTDADHARLEDHDNMTLQIQAFGVVELLGDLIQRKVPDPDKNRAAIKDSRWVWPTFPDAESLLPQAVVEISDTSFQPGAAGDFLKEETLADGTFREYYYRKSTHTFHVYVLTAKNAEFEIQALNQTLYLKNKKFNVYLADQVKNALHVFRSEVENAEYGIDNLDVKTKSPVFEDEEYSWATDITGEITGKDVWVNEYHEGELVKSYSLQVVVL